MLNRKIATLVILTSLFLSAFATLAPRVHAAGTLYIDPASQPLAINVGTTVTYSAKVSSMDTFNGWDIQVAADPNALMAMSVSVSGNMLGAGNELVNCVNGGAGFAFNTPGNIGCSGNDGPGLIHSAFTSGTSSAMGSSGLLFTITYSAVNNSPGSFIGIFNDVIASAGASVSHTATSGVYGTPAPDISTSASQANVVQGSSNQSLITLTSLGGFADNVQVSFITVPAGLSAFLTPSSGTVFVPVGGANTLTLTIDAALNAGLGTQTIVLQANSNSLASPKTIDAQVSVTPAPAAALSCGSPIMIPAGTTGAAVITGTSLNVFFGGISLSTSAPTGLTATVNPSILTLGAGASAESVLSVSANPSLTPGSYMVTVSGSAGIVTASCQQTIIVTAAGTADFTLSSSLATLEVTRGGYATSSIALTALNGFTDAVTLQTVVTPTLVLNPKAVITPLSGGMATLTVSSVWLSGTSRQNGQLGPFTVAVIGTTASGVVHAVYVAVNVRDFGLVSPSPAALFTASSTDDFDLLISTGSIFGFTGIVTWTSTISPNVPNAPGVILPFTVLNYTGSNFGKANQIVTLTSTSATPGGSYLIKVTGTYITSQGVVVKHSVTLFADVQTFTISGAPSPLVIRHKGAAGSGTSTITISGVDGFADNVTLAVSVPSVTGLAASLSTNLVFVQPNPDGSDGSVTATLSVSTTNHTPAGQYAIIVTGTAQPTFLTTLSGPTLVISTTVLVNVPSNAVSDSLVSFSPSVSVSGGGVQTWTFSVTNNLATTQYVQITVSGISTLGTRPFQAQSAVVAVAAGATTTVTVSQTFTSMDKGLTFNFNWQMFFGSSATTLNQVFLTPAKGQFTAVA